MFQLITGNKTPMNTSIKRLVSAAVLLVSVVVSAQESTSFTTRDQSPAINQNGSNSTVRIYYDRERIGKKIAIRKAYLVPTPGFWIHECAGSGRCLNFYETAFLYVEIQSIWPEPVLLTAAQIEMRGFQSKFPPRQQGGESLGERVTEQVVPGSFLLQPGEIKLITLGKGVRLDGILDFFRGDVLNDPLFCDAVPCLLPNFLARVAELNHFFAVKYGRGASMRVKIYEKDYQPLLVTDFRLADGGSIFDAKEGIKGSSYRLNHDNFIAEVLYMRQEGAEPFYSRQKRKKAEERH